MVQHSRFAWLVWLVWMHSAITCIVFNDDRRSCMSWTKQTTNRKNTDQPKSWTCWRLSKSRPLSSCMRTACPPRVRARFRPWPAGHSCRRQATTPRTNPHMHDRTWPFSSMNATCRAACLARTQTRMFGDGLGLHIEARALGVSLQVSSMQTNKTLIQRSSAPQTKSWVPLRTRGLLLPRNAGCMLHI